MNTVRVTQFDGLSNVSRSRFEIDASGRVGIGKSDPEYPLHMGSGAYVTTGGTWTNASSLEYKEDIRELEVADALAAVEDLQAVRFKYIEEDKQYVGFIAEHVPELVATADRKGLSAMDIAAVLTPVVQHQLEEIRDLKAENEELKARLAAIESAIANMQ